MRAALRHIHAYRAWRYTYTGTFSRAFSSSHAYVSFPSPPPSFKSSISSLVDFSTDPDVLTPHCIDWQRKFDGRSNCIGIAFPKSSKDVSSILKLCSDHSIGVVPQGGNTSLVGGAVPSPHRHPQIILSTAKMASVESFDESSGVVICGSGIVLESLNEWLEARGFIVPVDLGAKGSCRIGGNVSTNAGGLRLVRYGSLHGNVLGVEAVLPNGEIIDLVSSMRKDNTGIDLKHLFIGSEGTLGVITKIALLCPRKPKSVQVCLLGVTSFSSVIDVMATARRRMGEIISAIEFFDGKSLQLVLSHIPNTRDPLTSAKFPFYVLVETHGSNESHDKEKMNDFIDSTMTDEIVKDGIICQDSEQMKAIWKLRESITESLAKNGKVFKYDISLPPKVMYTAVDMTAEVVERGGYEGAVTVGYGHIGDSNLHLNVSFPPNVFNDTVPPFVKDHMEPAIYEFVRTHRGSVSAEHGIGQMKREYLHFSKSDVAIDLMKSIKKLLDPKGILNPNKIFLSK